MAHPLKDGWISVRSFHARAHPENQVGPTGLPLVPNSITVLGRFKRLTALEHANLCSYLDLERCFRDELVVVASEGYGESIKQMIFNRKIKWSSSDIQSIVYQLLSALKYLNDENIVHMSLDLDTIFIKRNNQYNEESSDNVKYHIKLAGYGLWYMTDGARCVNFNIGKMATSAPETLLHDSKFKRDSSQNQADNEEKSSDDKLLLQTCTSYSDVWSLAVTLLQILAEEEIGSQNEDEENYMSDFLLDLLLNEEQNGFNSIVSLFSSRGQVKIKSYNTELLSLIESCFHVKVSDRPSAAELLSHAYFTSYIHPVYVNLSKRLKLNTQLRSEGLTIKQIYDSTKYINFDNLLSERSIDEIYYFWKLAGGSVQSVIRKNFTDIYDIPPILDEARLIRPCGELIGGRDVHINRQITDWVVLDLSHIMKRLNKIPAEDFYPLIFSTDETHKAPPRTVKESENLPLIIRENDLEYQFHRVLLYDRLIKGYPDPPIRAMIQKQSKIDISPFYRLNTWAALLDIQGDIYKEYEEIDKVSEDPIDRQLAVDIPRCHQYNELMSSPEAHTRLKRLLKAWLKKHPQYVYWQGLDSLTAPFLYLSFNDEALAYSCLKRFIQKYLHDFFLKDNSAVLQEYLALFSQMVAFHDPELSNHLCDIGFLPDLYAIPWFLTMFAHVFPLNRLVHLWDTLLLGASVFPIAIGAAILVQIRTRLLEFEFNDCIVHFGETPDLKIDRVCEDAIKLFRSTPRSSTIRKHAPTSNRTFDDSIGSPAELGELKHSRCFRMSHIEVLDLLNRPHGPNNKPSIILLDIRNKDEYYKGTLPSAVSVPAQTDFINSQLGNANVRQYLDNHRSQVKLVVDNNSAQSPKIAAVLVKLGYQYVCYLQGGLQTLKGSSNLIAPTTENPWSNN